MAAVELTALIRGVVESAPEAMVVVDDDRRVVFVNEAAERVFGYTREELLGSTIDRVIPDLSPAQHPDLARGLHSAPGEDPEGVVLELSGVHKDGHEFATQISLRPVTTGESMFVAVILRDLSALRRAQEASAWLTAIVESTGDAVVGLGLDGTIASWNPAAARLYGYLAAEVIGQPDKMLAPRTVAAERAQIRARVMAGNIVSQLESEVLRKDGSKIPVAITASPIRDGSGKVIGVAQIVRDVTARTRFEHELKFFADHDPLTALFNRRRFGEELGRYVAAAERYPQQSGGVLLMGDLDNFKFVNDTVGHKAGDELLKAVAHMVRSRLRDTDVLTRLGGDEFAALLPRADLEEGVGVAESLRKAVSTLELVIDGHKLRTTMSIGVAPIRPHVSAETSLADADAAMYAAKRAGRDRVATSVPEEQRPEGVERNVGWAERLRSALSEDRFELYAQPIVEIDGGRVTRKELLLRLRENGELVHPSAFIYTAERFGLIEEIDRYVISRAVALLDADRGGDTNYHVNLSGNSITSPDLMSFLKDELHSRGADPARLTLELTETAAIIDMNAAQTFARGLNQIGCPLALDDFGSGFGSFSYLKYVPVQFLKIDGSFVSGMADSSTDRLLVKAIIDVAHGMRIKAVAEHVTSDKTRDLLRDLGADYGQGYHLGEPQPVAGTL